MPYLLPIAGLAGAGATIFGAASAANAAKTAAKQQAGIAGQGFAAGQGIIDSLSGALGGDAAAYEARIKELLAQGRSDIDVGYKNSLDIIKNVPTVSKLYPDAEKLSRSDFDFRTVLKRENLDFVLGDTKDDLRLSQSNNADLANLNGAGFLQGYNNIIKSNLLGLKAQTVGEPTGTFANLSAKNLFAFSQQGLSNELAINDFFSKTGTVDPISPLQTAFQLEGVSHDLAKLGIQNEQWQSHELINLDSAGMQAAGTEFQQQTQAATQIAGLSLQSNNDYYKTLMGLSGVNGAADAHLFGAIGPAIAGLGQAGLSAYGLSLQQQALTNQSNYQSKYLDLLGAQSINKFAPSSYSNSNGSGSLSNQGSYVFSNGAYEGV